MNEFYNCNFKRGDIIIGINPQDKFSYLKIFIIKDIHSHDEYGREIVDHVKVDSRRENDISTDINNYEIGIRFLNRDYRKINIEDV